MALVASKQLKKLHLLKPKTLAFTTSLLRHFPPETSSHPPPPPGNVESHFVNQVIELLQQYSNNNDVTTGEKLRHLLFPASNTPPSNLHLDQITRRLGSQTKAFKLIEWLRNNKPPDLQDLRFLSCAIQSLIELMYWGENSAKELYDLFEKSKEWNVPLTVSSANLLVRCFGHARMVDESLRVYEYLDIKLRDTGLRNVLIDILVRSGRIRDAFKMLDEMFQPDVKYVPDDHTIDIVFGGLLGRSGFERSVSDEEVCGLALKFGARGIFLNSIMLTQLITKLCRSRKTNRAWELLLEVIKMGGTMGVASFNSLLAGLGRDGKFDKIDLLLAKMKEMDIKPNVVTLGILINHLCKNRRVDDALEVLKRMKGGDEGGVSVEPDAIIYNTLIDGLCKVGREEEGLGLLEVMRSQQGCAPSTVTYNCLIDGFCKSGEIEKASKIFDEMNDSKVSPSVITINTLIDGMCKNGRISTAVDFFRKMQKKGIKGNAVTYTSLINAFCNSNNIDRAMQLLNEMIQSKCSPDAIVYYTLISGLTLAGRLDDVREVVAKLKNAGFFLDIVCYNTLMGGFCQKNKVQEAFELLKEMEMEQVKPDCVTYNTLISYFSKKGDFETVHNMMKKMTSDGIVPNVVTFGSLIHAYCINDKHGEAMKVFRQMSTSSRVLPNTVIYNIIIGSLCRNNDVETALSLLEDMKIKGLRSGVITYNAIFKGLQEKNYVDIAFKIMDRMTEESCIPDYITMEILTQWLSAVDEIEKLRKFVQGYTVCASSG